MIGSSRNVTATIALTEAYIRIRVRALRILLFNPLALVFAVLGAAGYIWVLVSQGDVLAKDQSAEQPYIASLVFGLCIILVSLTAQRGSPLRFQPGDVSWALQSYQGPRIVILVHSISSSVMAFIGSSVASSTALYFRGEPLIYGFISGFAVMSVLLALRMVSLGSHLIGNSNVRWIRIIGVICLTITSIVWVAAFLHHFFRQNKNIWSEALTTIATTPFRAIFEPERGDLSVSLLALALSIVVLSVLIVRADAFVESAVHESILANQLSKVLSGGQVAPLQGRGYKSGLKSWTHWPQSPLAAVLFSHLAQARRRRLQYIGTAATLNVIVLVPLFLSDYIPGATGIVIALLILTLSTPSQSVATELDHQHLLLANVSLCRVGFASVCLNALLDLVTCAPAIFIGLWLYFGSPGWALLFLLPLAIYTLSASLAGISARAFSDAPAGRAFFSLLLCGLPFLIALVTVSSYGEANVVVRMWLTVSGTMIVSSALYASVTMAVFISARPGSSLGTELKPAFEATRRS